MKRLLRLFEQKLGCESMNINYYLSFRNRFAAINQRRTFWKDFSKTALLINQISMKTYMCPFFSLDSVADHHGACIQELDKKVSSGCLHQLD